MGLVHRRACELCLVMARESSAVEDRAQIFLRDRNQEVAVQPGKPAFILNHSWSRLPKIPPKNQGAGGSGSTL